MIPEISRIHRPRYVKDFLCSFKNTINECIPFTLKSIINSCKTPASGKNLELIKRPMQCVLHVLADKTDNYFIL